MLEQLVRPYIPVEAFAQERVEKIEVPVPDVGLRWGKEARFRWDAKDSSTPDTVQITHVGSDADDKYIRIYRAKPGIFQTLVQRPAEADQSVVKIDRLESIWFYYIQTLSNTDVGSLTYLSTYVGLYFNLHPDNDET